MCSKTECTTTNSNNPNFDVDIDDEWGGSIVVPPVEIG